MVKYRKIMGRVRCTSWVLVHVNVRWDRNGTREIRTREIRTRKEKIVKRKRK